MKQTKHQPEYNAAMDRAESDFRTADGREMKDKCPYLFSSDNADAYWITAYALYHVGKRPRLLHKSRGHTWLTDIPGIGETRCSVNAPDQREGVILQ